MDDLRDEDIYVCEECGDELELYSCDCHMELCEYCIHQHAQTDCDMTLKDRYYE